MVSFERVGQLLDEIAEEFPPVFYRDLNGGILLLPETKPDTRVEGNLYILGEYCHERDMGRYIRVYYGSLNIVYPRADEPALRAHLRALLSHEFTHHMESLAGERGLEIKDEEFLRSYRAENSGGHPMPP